MQNQISFNLPDNYHINNLFEDKFKNVDNGISRVSVKHDYKIASQYNFNKINYLTTEDEHLFALLNLLQSEKKH